MVKKILLSALAIYLLLASLTYHPDNKLVLSWASQNQGKVWNIWHWGTEHPQKIGHFNYPPLHFYLDKLQYAIAKPIAGEGFSEWLVSPNSLDHNQSNLARYSLAIKTPLILFTVLAAYLLFLIAKQQHQQDKSALLVSALWLFNPVTVYSVAVMGQNDVMAIVFFLAAWYYLNRNKNHLASILFGLAASVKMFPLLWLPFLLLVDNRLLVKKRIQIFLASAGVYVLTLLPFVFNPVFRQSVFNSGIDRFFIARLGLGFEDNILIVPILLMLSVFGVWPLLHRIKKSQVIPVQAYLLLLVNALLLFFSHFHPQWFTWLIPFWALWLVNSPQKQLVNRVLVSVSVGLAWIVIILLFNDSALSFGLLTTLNPNLASLPSLRELLSRRSYPVELWNNYAHSWLAGSALLLLIPWLKGTIINTPNRRSSLAIKSNRSKQVRLSKSLKYLISATVLALASYLLIFTSHLIPAPLTDNDPLIVEYLPVDQELTQSFTAQYNGLNRLDLYFSNPELANREPFLISLSDTQDQLVFQQQFSGFNTGIESQLRFDLPIQELSAAQNYNVSITPLTDNQPALLVATTEAGQAQQFAIKASYKKPKQLNFVWQQSWQTTKDLVKQMPWFYIVWLVLWWLAI